MNLNNYKFIQEDEENFHVASPSGRVMKVSKLSVVPKAADAIRALKTQHFDVGGQVADISEEEKAAVDEQRQRDNFVENGLGSLPIVGQMISEQVYPEMKDERFATEFGVTPPMKPVPVPVPVPVPAPAMAQPQAMPAQNMGPAVAQVPQVDPMQARMLSSNDLISQQQDIARKTGEAKAKAGNQMANVYDGFAKQVALKQMEYQNILNSYKKQDEQLMKSFLDKKEDPNHYLKGLGTAAKVGAGIGVILAGMGSHATGGRNLALEQINKAIDNDIAAQRNEQGKALTTWKMNREAMGNDLAANLATQNQMWTAVQARISQIDASSKGPLAKLRADQVINQLEQQKNENRFKLSLMQQASQDGDDNRATSMLIQARVPKELQKKAYEEVEMINGYRGAVKEVRQAFNELKKITVLGANNPLSVDKAKMDSLTAGLIGKIRGSMKGQGALSDQEIEDAVKPLLANKKGFNTEAQLDEKEKGLIQLLGNKIQGGTPILDGNMVPINKAPYSPQEQKFIKEAQAILQKDPNNAVAKAALKKLRVY